MIVYQIVRCGSCPWRVVADGVPIADGLICEPQYRHMCELMEQSRSDTYSVGCENHKSKEERAHDSHSR